MEQPVSWRQHFKIPSDKLRLSLSQVLLSGLIPEAEYLKWAQNTFGLPVVTDTFFQIPEDPIYWDSICHLYKWNPNFFPLTEWDGVMLIGCMEPPTEFRFARDYRLVLVSPKHLQTLWQKLNPDLAMESDTPQPPPVPSRIETQSKPAEILPDILSRLSAELPPESLSENNSPGSEEPPPAEFEMPEGLSMIAPFDIKIPQSLKSPEKSAEKSAKTVVQAPRPVAPVTLSKSNQETEEATHTKVFIPKGEVRPIFECETIEQISEQALLILLKDFKAAMVIIREKEGLVPWKWTQGFASPKNSTIKSISLETPSIFSIVMQSKQPFHGSIRPSDENNKFFAAFDQAQMPHHASLVPVLIEGKIMAMLMGICDQPMDYRYTLPPLEKLAVDIGLQVVKFRSVKAA
jgi:hypothetical protein